MTHPEPDTEQLTSLALFSRGRELAFEGFRTSRLWALGSYGWVEALNPKTLNPKIPGADSSVEP